MILIDPRAPEITLKDKIIIRNSTMTMKDVPLGRKFHGPLSRFLKGVPDVFFRRCQGVLKSSQRLRGL